MSDHEIQIQLSGLIQLLANNLYAEPDVCIREMIQNANDSIVRRGELCGQSPPPQIRIRVDPLAATLRFIDNGSGLTEPEIHEFLSTIGRSGTGELRTLLQARDRAAAAGLIGQFGIGLLSAFTAAHTVEVHTRSCQPGSTGLLWRSAGEKTYQVRPLEREEPGSEVTLYIKDSHRDLLNPERIRQAVRLYADFIRVPIFLGDDPVQANTVTAPWDREYASEGERLRAYYRFIDSRVQDVVMEVIPVVMDQPVRVRGVLYVTSRQRPDIDVMGAVDVYISRMLIARDHDGILPPWAKFIRGVIESPDLTPTAARDNVQRDEALKQAREALGQLVIAHLRHLADTDPAKFMRLMDYHHYHIKGMALEDEGFFAAMADLVPFETNRGSRTLPEYLGQQPPGETRLLYFSERGAGTQIYLLCDAQGLEVINGSYVHEEAFLRRYAELKGVRVERLDIGGSRTLFQPLDEETHAELAELEKEYAYHLRHLNVRPVLVRFKPVELPTVLTAGKGREVRKAVKDAAENEALPEAVRAVLKEIAKADEDEPSPALTLYVNADNATIRQLRDSDLRGETAQLALTALYNNAVMMSAHLQSPENARAIAGTTNAVLHRFIDQSLELTRTRKELVQLRQQVQAQAETQADARDPWVTCFVALPFAGYEDLLAALRRHFEGPPWFWEVLRADKRYETDSRGDIDGHLTRHLARARVFLAEISDGNPNVMIEVGRMQALAPTPLLFLVRREDAVEIADLDGKLKVPYPRGDLAALVRELEKFEPLHAVQAPARFLSPLLLEGQPDWLAFSAAEQNAIHRYCPTFESVLGSEISPAALGLDARAWRLLRRLVEQVARRN